MASDAGVRLFATVLSRSPLCARPCGLSHITTAPRAALKLSNYVSRAICTAPEYQTGELFARRGNFRSCERMPMENGTTTCWRKGNATPRASWLHKRSSGAEQSGPFFSRLPIFRRKDRGKKDRMEIRQVRH